MPNPVTIEELVAPILLRRNQILDEFAKAFIAENATEPSNVRDMILIETRSFDGMRTTWHFEVRKS